LCGRSSIAARAGLSESALKRREQHGHRDRDGELLEDFAADSADERHRNEHRSQNERDRHHGAETSDIACTVAS